MSSAKMCFTARVLNVIIQIGFEIQGFFSIRQTAVQSGRQFYSCNLLELEYMYMYVYILIKNAIGLLYHMNCIHPVFYKVTCVHFF